MPSPDQRPPSETAPDVARRLSRRARGAWTAAIFVSVVLALAYGTLGQAQLKQTTALFVGLPVLLGLLTAHLTHARSLFGQVVRTNILFLAVTAPLLGEGSICLLMAAPLFIAISLGVAWIYFRLSRRSRYTHTSAMLLLPLALGAAEKHTDVRQPALQAVVTKTVVQAPAAALVRAMQTTSPIARNTSAFLGLGFPLPSAYDNDGQRARIDFRMADRDVGSWMLDVTKTPMGVHFSVREDTSKIGTWIALQDSRAEVRTANDGTVFIEQVTRFRTRLAPHDYFEPFERWAMAEAHQLAANSWVEATRNQP